MIPTKVFSQGYIENLKSYKEIDSAKSKNQLKDVNTIKLVEEAEIEINNCFVYSYDILKGRCPMNVEIKNIELAGDTLYTIKIVFGGKGKDDVNTPSYISKKPFFRYERNDNIEYHFNTDKENFIIFLDKKEKASFINCNNNSNDEK